MLTIVGRAARRPGDAPPAADVDAPPPPWLRLTLRAAPAPPVAELCAGSAGGAPQPLALRALRGRGELDKLVRLVARELLPHVAKP